MAHKPRTREEKDTLNLGRWPRAEERGYGNGSVMMMGLGDGGAPTDSRSCPNRVDSTRTFVAMGMAGRPAAGPRSGDSGRSTRRSFGFV